MSSPSATLSGNVSTPASRPPTSPRRRACRGRGIQDDLGPSLPGRAAGRICAHGFRGNGIACARRSTSEHRRVTVRDRPRRRAGETLAARRLAACAPPMRSRGPGRGQPGGSRSSLAWRPSADSRRRHQPDSRQTDKRKRRSRPPSGATWARRPAPTHRGNGAGPARGTPAAELAGQPPVQSVRMARDLGPSPHRRHARARFRSDLRPSAHAGRRRGRLTLRMLGTARLGRRILRGTCRRSRRFPRMLRR